MAFFTWHKVTDPGTGWLASKTSGWTADSFSGGLEVDFSAVVPVGTKAVRVVVYIETAGCIMSARKAGDSNISNTPEASNEYSCRIFQSGAVGTYPTVVAVLWLSADGKVDIAVSNTATDLYVAYPVEVLM